MANLDELIARESVIKELEVAGKAAGMVETAVGDLIDRVDQFGAADGGVVVHRDTGLPLIAWLESQKTIKLHWWPQIDIASELAEKAFGQGNLTAQGQLIAELGGGKLGIAAARDIAHKWQSELGSTKPGKRPGNADDKSADAKPKLSSTNPWLKANWNITKQAGVVRSLGAEKAAGIAKAAGCVLGSTKPNPAFN
jgi:hypothetical protein